jgi:hypothetical protein
MDRSEATTNGRVKSIRLEGKSTGFGHNSPKNGNKYKKNGKIAIFCINI